MDILVLDLYKKRGAKGGRRVQWQLAKYEADISKVQFHSPYFSASELEGYDGIVLTGSDSLDTYGKRSFETGIRAELLEQSDNGVMMLGICGGNLLLATVFKDDGYKRLEMEAPELGWQNISLTDQGEKSPLFKGMDGDFMAFESHFLSVRANDEQKVLAKRDKCDQAFQYRPNVFGVQFHPEHTPKTSMRMIKSKKMYKDLPQEELSQKFPMPRYHDSWRVFENFIHMISETF